MSTLWQILVVHNFLRFPKNPFSNMPYQQLFTSASPRYEWKSGSRDSGYGSDPA